jgi:hypothetical protein
MRTVKKGVALLIFGNPGETAIAEYVMVRLGAAATCVEQAMRGNSDLRMTGHSLQPALLVSR